MKSKSEQRKYRNVILIDDSKLDRFILIRMMELLQFADYVVGFYSPSSALKYLEEHATNTELWPEIVFVDLNMPEMSGFKFLNSFHKLSKPVNRTSKIVMLTASFEEEENLVKAKTSGAAHLLSKPVSPAMLASL